MTLTLNPAIGPEIKRISGMDVETYLSRMTLAYLEAVEFTESESLDGAPFAHETLAAARATCLAFLSRAGGYP